MRDQTDKPGEDMSGEADIEPDTWLKLRLLRKVTETAQISSFYLEPVSGGNLPAFKAGQYLTLSIPQAGERPLLRTYTVSSSSADRDFYRITVKREPAPADQPDVAAGIGSTYLHDTLTVGDVIDCLPPRGRFVVDDSARPLVLLSGGVGITPMLAMLAEQAYHRTRRPIWFVHACQTSAHQVLRDEISDLTKIHGGARALSVFETAGTEDTPDHVGHVDMAFLKKHLPFDDYSFYLCGPPGFMAALYEGLTSLNVSEDRIFYEFFGPASVLKPAEQKHVPLTPAADPGANELTVEFATSGQSVSCDGETETVLELARRSGIDAMHSCEEGVCGTCRCRLLEGEIEYMSEPIAYLEDGEILTCISRPKSHLKIDL